jgi:hypothetical protein
MSSTVKPRRESVKSADGGKPAVATKQPTAKMPQSAAAPSPFTPIADYGFISNCHTGALVAPDGSIDWLCVPRFDSPSVFCSLLDRGAGMFRLGPFGINVPAGRTYEPGTNTLLTAWKVPSGWALVRDALTIGPRVHDDEVTPHTRPPTDEDAHHMLIRTVECIDGDVEVELVCEPAFDYGRAGGVDDRERPARSRCLRRGTDDQVAERHAAGGSRGTARGRGTRSGRESSSTAHCRGPRGWRCRRRLRRPPRSSMSRIGSGANGSRGRGSPITRYDR